MKKIIILTLIAISFIASNSGVIHASNNAGDNQNQSYIDIENKALCIPYYLLQNKEKVDMFNQEVLDKDKVLDVFNQIDISDNSGEYNSKNDIEGNQNQIYIDDENKALCIPHYLLPQYKKDIDAFNQKKSDKHLAPDVPNQGKSSYNPPKVEFIGKSSLKRKPIKFLHNPDKQKLIPNNRSYPRFSYGKDNDILLPTEDQKMLEQKSGVKFSRFPSGGGYMDGSFVITDDYEIDGPFADDPDDHVA